jgi:hypothetical protein
MSEDKTPQDKVLDLAYWASANSDGRIDAICELVKECRCCRQAAVDADGSVWICNPQVGHYLSDAEILDFLAWVEKQKGAK